jgi:hypothetical protein
MSDSGGSGQMFKTVKIIGGVIILFVIFVIIRGGILAQIHQKEKKARQETFFEEFDKYFKGVIVKIKRRPPKEKKGIREVCYELRLIESTHLYYRPNNRTGFYFCAIDFPVAEVMCKDFGDVYIGDTVFYNGQSDCLGVKVQNRMWRLFRPEIDDYQLLKKPHTRIERYDSLQLEARKKFYPRKEIADIEQINYYWQHRCKKNTSGQQFENYNLGFHNYHSWRIHNRPEVLKKKTQNFFFMIQVAEYFEPLDMAELNEKYNGKPIVWVKENNLHKYFINQKIKSLEDAEDTLDMLIERYGLKLDDMPVIKKLKKKKPETIKILVEKKKENRTKYEEKYKTNTKGVLEIPYERSFLRYSWMVFILFTFINVVSQWNLVKTSLKKDKEFAKGFRHYVIGLLFFFNIWLVIVGIGIETGWVDSIFDFMFVKRSPIVIAANVYLIILLFTISRWIFVGNGAKILARLRQYPSGIFSPVHTEDGIRLLWTVYLFLGLIFIFARLFF